VFHGLLVTLNSLVGVVGFLRINTSSLITVKDVGLSLPFLILFSYGIKLYRLFFFYCVQTIKSQSHTVSFCY